MQIVDCNDTIINIFGTTKQYYIEHFFELAPEYQPNGDNSKEKILEAIKRALKGENLTIEWTHLTPAGELIPFEVTMTRTKEKEKYFIFSYQYELSHIKKITEEMKMQSMLLKVRLEQQELISEISRSFVSSADTKTLVKEAIAKLGHYYKVNYVVIFSLDYQSGEASLESYWSDNTNPVKRTKIDTQDFIKGSFPERLYDCATVPVLSCTDIATSNIEISMELSTDNVCAFICVPLYVEGYLWGLMAVEQNKPRHWTDNEKSFVAMTASTIASAIMLDTFNTKLKDAVTKMTAASKAKSEFLSNMSHEIRTPMNAIINMTLIAKNSLDIDRKNYALEKIYDASTHLLGVINDILDMSKIEANKFELVPVKFNFEKMLERVVNVINFRAEEKHQKLEVNIDKDIPKIMIGDDQRISQIIANLLSNSVKFTPENGSITLNAKFLEEKDEICKVQISVTDTGIGISKEQQKNLFKSFQQAESSTARNYGGTGLGLSISKNFVEMMGGNIWVKSEHDKGSTFAFTMNVKRCREEDEWDKNKTIQNIELNNFSGHRILLVEDMEINREIVMMMLEPTNMEIDCAVNGIQAVDMFIEEPDRYEAILMDIHMPGMDGYEATQQIRKYEKKLRDKLLAVNDSASITGSDKKSSPLDDSSNVINKHKRIPIIAMTANVFKEDIENCMKIGMDDHVGKPLDVDEVLKKLKMYLKR